MWAAKAGLDWMLYQHLFGVDYVHINPFFCPVEVAIHKSCGLEVKDANNNVLAYDLAMLQRKPNNLPRAPTQLPTWLSFPFL